MIKQITDKWFCLHDTEVKAVITDNTDSTLVLICKKCGNVISVEAKGSAFIKQEASDFYIAIEKKQIEK